MERIPDPPPVAPQQRAEGELWLRYQDIAQDGRLVLDALPEAMAAFWRELAPRSGIDERQRAAGVVPILAKMWLEGGQGPVGLRAPVRVDTRFVYARVDDAAGDVDKLILAVWADLTAPAGRVHGGPLSSAERIAVGRVFSEHVFTRLFAPKGERKVTALDDNPVLPAVPELRWRWPVASALAELPPDATPLEPPYLDPTPVVLGLDHSDSNHHTNALVYPRLFREAALRRLTALGHGCNWLARAQRTAYRKPTFAGETLRISLQCWRAGDTLGASLWLHDDGQDDVARGRCFGWVSFGA